MSSRKNHCHPYLPAGRLGQAATAAGSEDPVLPPTGGFFFVWIARSSRAMTGKKACLDCRWSLPSTAIGGGNDSRAAYFILFSCLGREAVLFLVFLFLCFSAFCVFCVFCVFVLSCPTIPQSSFPADQFLAVPRCRLFSDIPFPP